jgi:hypothetical protein
MSKLEPASHKSPQNHAECEYQDDFGGLTINQKITTPLSPPSNCQPLTLGGERLKLKDIALPELVSLLATATESWGS